MHFVVLMFTLLLGGSGQALSTRPTPIDPLKAILDALVSRRVVALDDDHGDERSHEFRVSLIRDARFRDIAADVVVEFGNAKYQPLMDRYISGESVDPAQLSAVWQNTTQAHTIWDRPIYRQFFDAVRVLNVGQPADRRIRVVLGDLPIDWDAVHTAEDRQRWLAQGRSRYPAELVRREVLSRGRRALIIYGALHLIRQNPQGPNLSENLQAIGVGPFVVLTHPFASVEAAGGDPKTWPAPSLALTEGTAMASQMDAVLYLGPREARKPSRLDPALCSSAEYRAMRIRRMSLAGFSDPAGQLAKECAPPAAQPKPDFSGVWVPTDASNPPKPPSPGGPPPRARILSLTISHTGAVMKVDRRAETEGRETVSTANYQLDGRESVNQQGAMVVRTTAKWKEDALVLSSVVSTDGRQLGELTEVYRLKDGHLIVEATRKVPAGEFTSTTVHRKR